MKGTKKFWFNLSGLAACLIAHSVFAECSIPMGWYVDGDVGTTKFSGKSYPPGISSKSSGRAWNVDLGYKFTPFLGSEIGYTRYAATRLYTPATGTVAKDRHTTIDVAAKLSIPISTTGIEPFLKLGVAQIQSSIYAVQANSPVTFNTGNKTSQGIFWGAGVAYYFSPNFAGKLSYQEARGNNNTGNPASFMVGFNFLFV